MIPLKIIEKLYTGLFNQIPFISSFVKSLDVRPKQIARRYKVKNPSTYKYLFGDIQIAFTTTVMHTQATFSYRCNNVNDTVFFWLINTIINIICWCFN